MLFGVKNVIYLLPLLVSRGHPSVLSEDYSLETNAAFSGARYSGSRYPHLLLIVYLTLSFGQTTCKIYYVRSTMALERSKFGEILSTAEDRLGKQSVDNKSLL